MVRFHSVPLFINRLTRCGVAYGILQFIISWVAGISKVDAETTIARTEQEKCRN